VNTGRTRAPDDTRRQDALDLDKLVGRDVTAQLAGVWIVHCESQYYSDMASSTLPTLTVTGRFVRAAATDETFQRTKIQSNQPVDINEDGLLRPGDQQQSYTYNVRMPERCKHPRQDALDRAVLVQCESHWADMRSAFKRVSLRQPLPSSIDGGEFGENLVCHGSSADDLCIGDKLALVVGRRRGKRARADYEDTLLLQISSPRRPCSKVDKKFGQTYNGSGVRAYCARSGRAGFLCRVLVPGTLPADGCTLRVIERPLPQWTLSRVSSLLYGMEGAADTPSYSLPGFDYTTPSRAQGTGGGRSAVLAKWKGTEEELAELAGLDLLAGFEWQDELRAMHEAVVGGVDATDVDAGEARSRSSSWRLWLWDRIVQRVG
jgi:MOSC domain-containing protein YiiM